MVHNGIEYGDMQLIAEAYDILKRGLGLEEKEIADIFGHVGALNCMVDNETDILHSGKTVCSTHS